MTGRRRSLPSAASPRTWYCSTSACPVRMATRWRKGSATAGRARTSSSSPSPAGVRRATRSAPLPPASITTSPSRSTPGSSMHCWSCEPPRSALLTIGRLAVAAVLSVDWAIGMPARAAAGVSEAQQQEWVGQAAADLPPRALATLQHIAGADRRLLAVRAYLRAGSSLDERWSWSQQQLDAYPTTAEAKLAAADIDAVIAAFSAANPGFTLGVNRLPRSLEVQIAHWNENRSVGITAAALVAALERQFSASAGAPDAAGGRRG